MMLLTYKKKSFVFISDTHGLHENLQIPPTDFLMHCGDFCIDGDEDQIRDFMNWFSKTPAKYKILISGNHDYPFVFEPLEALDLLPKSVIFLNNKIKTIEGITFYGLRSDYPLLEPPELCSKPIDFLLSHVPPKSVLDEGIGCPLLLDFVKIQQPKHHLFGHIHSFGQQTQILNETVFINCCCFTAI
jgi:Icc-related predicted phosphoesterase